MNTNNFSMTNIFKFLKTDECGSISSQRICVYYDQLLPSTFWTGLAALDYETNLSKSSVKSLLDLCLVKLVSDEFYVRHITCRIPPLFYSLLLKKAFDQGKVLSIMHLIKPYPSQTLTFPIPSNITNWSAFLTKPLQICHDMKPVLSIAFAVIKAFFSNRNSQLQILDMSQAFIPVPQLKIFLPLFEKDRLLIETSLVPLKTYTLKAGLVAINIKDMMIIRDFKQASLKNKYMKFQITGLHISSLMDTDLVEKLFSIMDQEELLHFSLDFSKFDLKSFIPKLQLFCNLQTLSMSYNIGLNFEHGADLAVAINSFVHLKQLSLKECRLSNLIQKLLMHGCNKKNSSTLNIKSNFNCCALHRGKLEYLNLSSCRLRNSDLLVLQEFSLTRSLRYLNLNNNFLEVSSLAGLLEKIGSFLVVLEIESCFFPGVQLKELFRKFHNLSNVKSLNIRELYVGVEEMIFLFKTLETLPELRQLALSKTDVLSEFCSEFGKLKSKKHLKVEWAQARHHFPLQQL